MQAALNQLGFRCYHMQDVPREPGHLKAWKDTLAGAPADWRRLFEGYEATVDAPACFYHTELAAEFPDALVVLTVRDPERWYDSTMSLMAVVKPLRPLARVIPKLGQFLGLVDGLTDEFLTPSREKAAVLSAVAWHNAAVQQAVPPERLLVFRVPDGWEPLCAFLDREVPRAPFPHLNEGSHTVRARLRDLFLGGPARVGLAVLAVFVASGVVWLLLR